MNTVIRVENLSKQYQLGLIGTGTFSHDIKRWWSNVRGKEDPYLKIGEVNDRSVKGAASQLVWALRDINFDVKQGEVLGIIGKNGAGKSTLLKILSRTTSPTIGSVRAKGRIASLLEVGTGFHPELTGRENIFLNGAILGMRKQEIKNKFDEIVDFSGVQKYIDTPVKRYSSGMYVRLAFAVAAHLESEILIVDEVLAVGDAEFQQKCLGKMKDVSALQGRTVLFVSHNLGVIHQLCKQTIVLRNGQVTYSGNTSQAIDSYLDGTEVGKNNKIEKNILGEDNQFLTVYNCDSQDSYRIEYKFDEEVILYAALNIPKWIGSLELALSLYDKHKRRIFTIHEPLINHYSGDKVLKLKIVIPSLFLTPGKYSWIMCLNHPGNTLYDLQDDVCAFTIMETGSEFSRYSNADYGCVFVNYKIIKIT